LAKWNLDGRKSSYHLATGGGKFVDIEFINGQWYWIDFDEEQQNWITGHYQWIKEPNKFGLGTKADPYLSYKDSL
jgi:hypothetical protein